jgi:cell division septation protein DedD
MQRLKPQNQPQQHPRIGQNETGSSSWDLVLKVFSITLVSLFAFSSGVWFGKKLSDSDHQRLALEGEFDKEVQLTASQKHVRANAEGGDLDDPSDALTAEEVAAATDRALAHASHGAETTQTAQTATTQTTTTAAVKTGPAKTAAGTETSASTSADTAKPATSRSVASQGTSLKPDLSAAHEAATRVANNAAPVGKAPAKATTPEDRMPSSLPKTVGASNDVEFTVQIASYPSAEAAREHVESMVKKGFPAFPVEAQINGKTWYRVSVGSFKSFNDASKFRAQLLKQADLPSAIVQKIAR